MISLKSVTELYDFIRMLDADGYPHAFIECGAFKIEFRNAKISNGRLLTDCIFLKINSEG